MLTPCLNNKLRLIFSIIFILALTTYSISQSGPEIQNKELPDTEFIILTRATWGLASFPIETIMIVKNNGKQEYEVWLGKNEKGVSRYFKDNIDKNEFISIFDKINKLGLWKLPLGNRYGKYGKGVGLYVYWRSSCWVNMMDTGCGEYPPSLQDPSEEERERFRQVVKFIKAIAEDNAKTPVNGEIFSETKRRLLALTYNKCKF